MIDNEFIELLKPDPTVNHETMDYNYDSESSEVEEFFYLAVLELTAEIYQYHLIL